ncbi:hypothetical protein QSH57_006969 [Fusarium oxysporum f. sp. vasinfectum]|nr:hypothetical protein QSH57_006969 [Fusarium oxysporum f. sp. vasinfectum]
MPKPLLSLLIGELQDAVLVAALADIGDVKPSGSRNACRFSLFFDRTAGRRFVLEQPSPQGLISQHPIKRRVGVWANLLDA